MRKYIGFLRISSATVRIVAWFFLCLGVLASIGIFAGLAPGYERWLGFVVLGLYLFLFFMLFLIARISGVLARLIDQTVKE